MSKPQLSPSGAIQATPDVVFAPARIPTMYFIGMTTGRSSIMKVFPRWAEHFGIGRPGEVAIQGIDCAWHDDPATYRRVVEFIRDDPLSKGALVTTHKIDLLTACRGLFDELDPAADVLGEISCIAKRGSRLRGCAKDPITSGLSLEALVPAGHWARTGGEVCLLGAGGSSLATTMYLMQMAAADRRPAAIRITNRSQARLDAMRAIHASMNPGIPISYHFCPRAEDNDAIVARLPAGSLVANATGLGKDAPGSPLTDRAVFPRDGLVWDFNYRGDLLFLQQARQAKAERNLTVEDGWVYFIHGWTQVIGEVFDLRIPPPGPAFDAICTIAANAN